MNTHTQSIQDMIVSLEPAALVDAFITSLKDRDRSACTVAAFRQDVNAFCNWCSKEYQLPFSMENFNRHDLRAFQRYCKETLSPATWNRRMSGLRAFGRWLQDQELLTYDPTDVFEYAEQQPSAPRWLTNAEFRSFTVALELYVNAQHKGLKEVRLNMRVRDQAMVCLMLYAGLRVAEVCGLNVGDVQLSDRKGAVTIRKGKGRKLRRVPVSPALHDALQAWLGVYAGQASEPLFISEEGERIQVRAVQRVVAEIGRLAKIEVTPHDLRHTCAKRMVNEHTGLEVVKEILGHASLNTTMIYVQPGWEDLARAVESI